jgi:hypothetical protein
MSSVVGVRGGGHSSSGFLGPPPIAPTRLTHPSPSTRCARSGQARGDPLAGQPHLRRMTYGESPLLRRNGLTILLLTRGSRRLRCGWRHSCAARSTPRSRMRQPGWSHLPCAEVQVLSQSAAPDWLMYSGAPRGASRVRESRQRTPDWLTHSSAPRSARLVGVSGGSCSSSLVSFAGSDCANQVDASFPFDSLRSLRAGARRSARRPTASSAHDLR